MTTLAFIIVMIALPFTYLVDGNQRIFLPYLIAAYIPVAIGGYLAYRNDLNWRKKADWQKIADFCFPNEIWQHPSHKLDLKFFLVNTILFQGMAMLYLGSAFIFSAQVEGLLTGLLGAPEKLTAASGLAVFAITVILLLAGDFAIFFAHWLQHKVPFLWEFHKIHHSAQVMTPITVYRMHPVDDLMAYFLGGVMGGIVVGTVNYLYLENPGFLKIFGLNLFTFIFYVTFYNLRHSHFWLHYGRLGHIFVSPAMHQIHHSEAKRHWDKNMGFVLSIWDKWFGTLYVPVEKEELKLGIGPETQEYDSLANLYFLPFEKNWQRWVKKWHSRRDDTLAATPDPATELPASRK